MSVMLTGCKSITPDEAGNIGMNHLRSQLPAGTPVVLNKVFLADDGWHVQATAGDDDEMTVIISKSGKVKQLHAYIWV
ncbi:MAG: hypothetical protein WC595_05010 [Candidatus Nanoarchaeia archaeon]